MVSIYTVSTVLVSMVSSATVPVVPSFQVNAAVPVIRLAPSLLPFRFTFNRIFRMFNSCNVNSSSAWLMPSLLLSIQTLRLPNASSRLSIIPSPLLSSSASASKPLAAKLPSAFSVRSPNSSVPLSIRPFPFKSRTSMPSPSAIHAVFSAKPSPS